jgi:hypothetical protein
MDLRTAQQAVIPPELHRPAKGFNNSLSTKKALWEAIVRVRAQREAQAAVHQQPELPQATEQVQPESQAKPLEAAQLPPVSNTPLLQAEPHRRKEDEYDEGESQLLFLEPLKITPAAVAAAMPTGPVAMPVPESVQITEQLMARQLTPTMALQALMQMSVGDMFSMVGDKLIEYVIETKGDSLAERMADKMWAKLESRMAGMVPPAKPAEAKAQATPVLPPAEVKPQVEARAEVKKPHEKGSLKDQLIQVAKTNPNLKKPQIGIIGMRKGFWEDLKREFPEFEFMFLQHANDGYKKMEKHHKVIGITEMMGGKSKQLREMHGSNFKELNSMSLTGVRRELEIWRTCYNEDATYFRMDDAQRASKNEEYANA